MTTFRVSASLGRQEYPTFAVRAASGFAAADLAAARLWPTPEHQYTPREMVQTRAGWNRRGKPTYTYLLDVRRDGRPEPAVIVVSEK